MGIGCSQCERDGASRGDDVYVSGKGNPKEDEKDYVILKEAPKDEELLPAELRSSATTGGSAGSSSRPSPPPPVIDQGGLVPAKGLAVERPAAPRPCEALSQSERTVSVTDRSAEEVAKSTAEGVAKDLPAGPRVCILGGMKFQDPATEALVTAIARRMARSLSGEVVVLTGGMPGVQAAFAKGYGVCSPAAHQSLVHLLPMGQASKFGVGRDVSCGATLEERMEAFGQLGQVYLCFEGGPGVANEAKAAFERGALVLPMISTGGASAGMFGFPKGALEKPSGASDMQWACLTDKGSPEQAAAAVVDLISAGIKAPPMASRDRDYLASGPGVTSTNSMPSAYTDGGDTFDTGAAGSTRAIAGDTIQGEDGDDYGARPSSGAPMTKSATQMMVKSVTKNFKSMVRGPSRMWNNTPSTRAGANPSKILDPSTGAPRIKAKPSGNSNMPLDYRWLERVLQALASNSANSLGCIDTATMHAFTPILLVLGVCPNTFCGMQAIMYCANGKGEIDFWWVKPDKNNPSDVEKQTLSRQGKGPHKNDPGRSKPFYAVLADMFAKGERNCGRRFGVDITSFSSPRCWIEETRSLPGRPLNSPRDGGAEDSPRDGPWKMWLNVVWIEDWTTNPFARSKFIKGKIVYQRDPSSSQFFARQYYILDGDMQILDYEEPSFDTVLPQREDFKDLWMMAGC